MKLKLSFLWKKRWWEESHWPTASSSLCYSFPLVLIHSGLSALLWDYRRDCPTSPKSSPMQFLYKTEPLRWMQTWKQLISNALVVHLTTKLPSANVLKHFHKLPGSLPAQPHGRPARWAACPRSCTHRRTGCCFQTLHLHDNAPEQTLWRTKSPWHIQTLPGVRSMARHRTWRPWNCSFKTLMQDVTNMKYSNYTNFTAALQYWQQPSYWLRRTASMKKNPYTQKSNCKTELLRMYFFFRVEQKMLKSTLKLSWNINYYWFYL